MQKLTRKNKIRIGAVFATIAACLLCTAGSLFAVFSNKAEALTSSTLTSATKAGGGAELWNSSSKQFNSTVIDDIYAKLFKGADPVTYIKNNGRTEYGITGSYVVPASTINSQVGNATYGLTVKLGGFDWMAASLTLADIGSEKDNVILTLYAADDYKTTSIYYSDSANTKGNNMYASSTLRNNLLTWSDYKLFSDGSAADSFAKKYLVQPQYIKYQEKQSQVGRGNAPSYQMPNDSYGAQSSNWYSGINYQPADTIRGVRYDAWKTDYIWIPSGTETGWNDRMNTECIWGLTSAQRAHSTQSYSWLRSGPLQ